MTDTDKRVEAVAKAIASDVLGVHWLSVGDDFQDVVREQAVIILAAADAISPPSAAHDRAIAERVRERCAQIALNRHLYSTSSGTNDKVWCQHIAACIRAFDLTEPSQ